MAAIDLQLHLELDEILAALQEAGWVRPVRCRECIHNRKAEYVDVAVDCELDHDFTEWVSPDWFCADGERKDGAE